MSPRSLFGMQPTFTQGLLLGQLSVFILLGLILKYLFLDSTRYPFESATYHPRADTDVSLGNRQVDTYPQKENPDAQDAESPEWFNMLARQIVDVYRSKLRDDLPGSEGDEIVRKRVEDYANSIRPVGYMDHIKIHSVDLGTAAPTLQSARTKQSSPGEPVETHFDATYIDTLSLSLSTSYLFNYPMISFARLPISLTISLSQFRASISVTPPEKASPTPSMTLCILPDFVLDLSTTSLVGSRAKLANVPKLHELIQHQVRRVLAESATWKIAIPGLPSVAEV